MADDRYWIYERSLYRRHFGALWLLDGLMCKLSMILSICVCVFSLLLLILRFNTIQLFSQRKQTSSYREMCVCVCVWMESVFIELYGFWSIGSQITNLNWVVWRVKNRVNRHLEMHLVRLILIWVRNSQICTIADSTFYTIYNYYHIFIYSFILYVTHLIKWI